MDGQQWSSSLELEVVVVVDGVGVVVVVVDVGRRKNEHADVITPQKFCSSSASHRSLLINIPHAFIYSSP